MFLQLMIKNQVVAGRSQREVHDGRTDICDDHQVDKLPVGVILTPILGVNVRREELPVSVIQHDIHLASS